MPAPARTRDRMAHRGGAPCAILSRGESSTGGNVGRLEAGRGNSGLAKSMVPWPERSSPIVAGSPAPPYGGPACRTPGTVRPPPGARRSDRPRPPPCRAFGLRRRALRARTCGPGGQLQSGSGAEPVRPLCSALGRAALSGKSSAPAGGGTGGSRHPRSGDRPAHLHHRPAAQRHDLPAQPAGGGSRQSGAAVLGDDLSLSGEAVRKGQPRPATGKGRAPPGWRRTWP